MDSAESLQDRAKAYRTGMRGALGALLGVLLSGPLAVVLAKS